MTRYETDDDTNRETHVATIIEQRFRCTLHHYPRLHPIDYYAERDDKVVAHIEIKCRIGRTLNEYSTVWLNLTKYEHLLHAWLAHTVPSLVVYAFTDTITYIDVADIKASPVRISGRTDRQNPGDRQPGVTIPTTQLRPL